jgi:hypothetical protein
MIIEKIAPTKPNKKYKTCGKATALSIMHCTTIQITIAQLTILLKYP